MTPATTNASRPLLRSFCSRSVPINALFVCFGMTGSPPMGAGAAQAEPRPEGVAFLAYTAILLAEAWRSENSDAWKKP
ncbi:hypothetical protein, partial [Achromobacter xylosoxidans]|uniref:hypothetical protein n=1 Tax=Alcaligenes xylosoxydans xylosoxydans TaxID=85698 RepID=UPI001E394CEF